MTVFGEVQQPTTSMALIVQLLSIVFLACILLMLTGDFLLDRIGVWGERIREFKVQYPFGLLLIGFIANQIAASISTTGAFEIYVGEELVWSKLETGQLPTRDILLDSVRRLLPVTLPHA